MRRRPLAITALLTLAITPSILPSPAHADVMWTTIATWDMDEPATGCGATIMEDKADAAGAQRGPNDGTIFTAGVSRNGDAPCPFGAPVSGRYKFLNWSNLIDVGGPGDPSTDWTVESGSITSDNPTCISQNNCKLSRVNVQDSSKLLNPGNSSFRMTTRFKPLNVWRSLDGGANYNWYLPEFPGDPAPSLNMFQRGPALGVGGQYKMELLADSVNRGKPRCIFRDSGYRTASEADKPKHEVVVMANATTNFHESLTSKVVCGLDRQANPPVGFIDVIDNHTGASIDHPIVTVPIHADFGSVDPFHSTTSERDFTVGLNYGRNRSDAYSGNFYYVELDIGS